MARPLQFGGGYEVQHAEELYLRSVAKNKPDFRYVALAIGASPAAPPSWALWACVEARQDSERKTANGPDKKTPPVLDELVRFFARAQWAYERSDQCSRDAEYRPPSFRSAVIEVARADPFWREKVGDADPDWYKPITRAWRWEQKHDPAPSSFWNLEGFVTTARIDRVMTQMVGAEEGDPEDVAVWAWVSKRISDAI